VLSYDDFDLSRFIFTGAVPPEELARILNLSDLHVYLTVPFVLSWSMMNALSCGCTVLASATPPVQEMITDGENGLLFPFHDIDRLVELTGQVLDDPAAFAPLGVAGRSMIEAQYSLSAVTPQIAQFYDRTAAQCVR
jgi:glycosyltransferase involved in cell wall biosynthesis